MAELTALHDTKHTREVFKLARQAMRKRDWIEACRFWQPILADAWCSAADSVDAAKAFREAGQYDEAEQILAQAVNTFPASESIAVARAWLANARCDWSEAQSRWKSVQARFPENGWGFVGYIHALRGAGQPHKVDAVLPALAQAVALHKQSGLDPESAFKLEIEVAKAQYDWSTVRSLAKAMATNAPQPSATVLLTLAQACWHLGDRDAADQAATRALAVDPALSEAIVVRAWVATDRGDGDTALVSYRRLAELNPTTVRWSLKVIQLLNRTGHVKDALAELDRVRRQWPADPMVKVFLQNYGPAAANGASLADNATPASETMRGAGLEEEELRTIAAKAPGAQEWRRPLLVPVGDREMLLAQAPHAETAVLVFTGSNDAVSMPLPLFDRFLAKLDVTAIYLKDFRRLRFLTGIESLSDNYQGTLVALRQIVDRMQIKRLCTLGNCDGGFAAIRYGIELDAERIIAFGAPTHASQDSLTKIEQARNFMKNRLAAKVPETMMDLKPFLESREHSAHVHLFYEEEDARDSVQALHLAGLPGVRLHPQPGLSNHYLLRRLALRSPDFAGFLSHLLALDSHE